MAEALPAPTITLPGFHTAAASMPWTGDNAPSSNMMAYNSTGGATGVNAAQFSSYWNKSTHHVEMQYSYGTFGKLPDDAVYMTRDRDTRVTADLTQPGSFYDVTIPSVDGTAFRANDFAVEFSFAFTDINDTTISGNVVATLTMVAPTINLGMPLTSASQLAPSTK